MDGRQARLPRSAQRSSSKSGFRQGNRQAATPLLEHEPDEEVQLGLVLAVHHRQAQRRSPLGEGDPEPAAPADMPVVCVPGVVPVEYPSHVGGGKCAEITGNQKLDRGQPEPELAVAKDRGIPRETELSESAQVFEPPMAAASWKGYVPRTVLPPTRRARVGEAGMFVVR